MTPSDQRRLLTRTFFSRMFESELLPQGMPQTQLVFSAVTVLAGPALGLPILFMKKYIGQPPAALLAFMAQDRALVLLLAMLAAAMAALVLWEKVIPDRRDCRTLGVLPIPPNTFVVARLSSIVALFALLFVGSTLLWALTLGTVQSIFGVPGGWLRNVAGLFVAVAGLEAAVFFGIIGLQCLIVATVGATLAQRLAVVMQVLLVVLIVQLPLLLPRGDAFFSAGGAAPRWTEPGTLWPLPSLWFMELHAIITAGGHAGARSAGLLGAALAAFVPIAALVFYAASYRRLTRLAIEGRAPQPHRHRLPARVLTCLARGRARTSQAAAVCGFTVKTLARSQQHRMLFSVWLGVAIALIVSALLPLVVGSGAPSLDHPRPFVLVVPLILMTLIMTGMRALFALPTEIRANWVFRLAEPVRPDFALGGAAAALAWCAVLPAAAVAAISVSWLWGVFAGIQHAMFCSVLGIVLIQVLVRGLDKIPFTCTYVPGKSRVTSYWPAYLMAFATLTYGMASLEGMLLKSVAAYLTVTGILGALAAGLRWSRIRAARQLVSLRFQEEEPDQPTLLSLTATR